MMTQTINLLDECNAGCKMAMNSMSQVMEYVRDEDLANVIDDYTVKHQKLEEETSKQLAEYGKEEKEPGMMASAMSWISTEAKLMMKDDSRQVAKIMMDGCNMGIQSVSEYMNKYEEASPESINLAKKIIKTEEDFMGEMKQFL
ncbi:MAG: hypothetical protein HFJ06_07265 [Lachnospiraceae bacterium]|nr:hypothetical protein [Lachnospiraceae bacterium]